MILTANTSEKYFPQEAVLNCMSQANQICRRESAQKCLGAEQGRLTLLEMEQPELYTFYDIFEIQEFSFSDEKANGHLKIRLSLLDEYRDLKVWAQILDLEKETVIAELPVRSVQNTNHLFVDEDFEIALENGEKKLGVIAFGDWGNSSSDEQELAAFRKANSMDADYVYKHVYPKKEKETVTFGTIEKKGPNPGVTGDKDHIVIALIRQPYDLKDVDYLCGFGRDSKSGHPVLCVPGQGDLIFSENETPKTDDTHKNSAVCKLYRKGGGAAIIAGTEAYKCDQTINITPMGHGYHYEFISWKVGYDDPANWKKTEFDYELEMIVHTVSMDNNGEIWHSHHLRVSSMSSKRGFTAQVLALQVFYGCMAPWTAIRMADGSKKEIRWIGIGDMVQGKGNQMMRVTNIWRGEEIDNLVEIHSERMKEKGLLVTKNHPIWVKEEDGSENWKPAFECRKGDLILEEKSGNEDRSEFCPITAIVEKESCGEVYNLDLEPSDESGAMGKGSMFCEGILTGDNQIQNGIGR